MHPLPFSGHPGYSAVFWLAYAVWTLPEIVASKKLRSDDKSRSRDRGSLVVVVVVCFFSTALGIYLSNSWLRAAIPYYRAELFWAGIACMPAGIALRWYAILTLGKSFTFDVAVQRNQRIVDTGPYRFIRHPSYTGALITVTGLGLSLGNWAALIIPPACFLLAYA